MAKLSPILVLTGLAILIGCAPAPAVSYLDGEQVSSGKDDADDKEKDDDEKDEKDDDKDTTDTTDTDTSNTDDTTDTDTDPLPEDEGTGTDEDAQFQCFDQCAAAAGGGAAAYWSCSANCQDQACDDKCWNTSCGGTKEAACDQALTACDDQCFGGQ